MSKHVVNGDQENGWYCYECPFFTRDVGLAAEHDGMRDELIGTPPGHPDDHVKLDPERAQPDRGKEPRKP